MWLSTGFLLVLLLWFLCPTGQLRSQPSRLMNPNSDTHTWLGHLQALCPETWEKSSPAPPFRGSRGEPLFPLGTPSVLHVHDLEGVGGAWFSIPVSGQRQALGPERFSLGEQPTGALVQESGASPWSGLPSLVHLRKKSVNGTSPQKERNCVVHTPVSTPSCPGASSFLPPAGAVGHRRQSVRGSGPHLSTLRDVYLLPDLGKKLTLPWENPLMTSREGGSVQTPWGAGKS